MKPPLYEVVCFGEVLWDLLPSGPRPGGAPMNVAYHIQKLGLEAALISKIGRDNLGEELKQTLSLNGLTTAFIQSDPMHATGVVNATIGANNEVSYQIVHPVAWDFIDKKASLDVLVQQSRFFIYGSLVGRDEYSRRTLTELLSLAQTKVLDINLRPPHFTRDFIDSLLHSADIIKLNEHELPLISSWYHSFQEEEEQALWLQERFSIATVIVTKGSNGAFVCREGCIFRHPGFRVKVTDTIGSGDAFLAAFLFKYRNGASIDDCLQFANSLGAFIATKSGACPEYDAGELLGMLIG
jgi:fructokinase